MDNAISIYLGGEEVYAKNCHFNSYLELGLICPVCKQEVYLRRGDIKETYFAHFHASNSRQVKQCSRRVSSDENATETDEFIEDRGQRLKIFQDHFLSKFSIENSKIVDDVNFKKWINSKKGGKNKAINNIIEDCIEYFIKHRRIMTDKYIIHPTKIKDKQTLLQQQIALQVMSYLCENANFNRNLRYLLSYSIFQLYRHNQRKDIDKICQYTMNIIMCNPWITVFKSIEINNNNNTTQSKIIIIKKNKISCNFQLLTNINELEIKLNTIKASYEVRKISIKSSKIELEEYLDYLLDIEQQTTITNLTKYKTSDSTVNSSTDLRTQHLPDLSGHDISNELMKVTDDSYSTVEYEVTTPEVTTDVNIESIKSVTIVSSHTKKQESSSLVGSGQDSIFWLRKVYLQITNQVMSQVQQLEVEQMLFNNSNTKVSEILQRSDTFKKFLTFRCSKPSDADLEYLQRINWTVDIDDTWGDYIISPDFTKVDKIKFSTIIRILKYSVTNEARIDNDYLINRYFGKDNLLRCPLLMALDILSNNIGINHANSVLASALKIDVDKNTDRIVQVRKNSYPVNLSFTVPTDTREQITDSVKVRTIGKQKRVTPQTRGSSKPPRTLDEWCVLSQRVNNTEIEIIAINSPSYRDSFLVFKRYQLEKHPVTHNLDHPQWLLSTQKQYGIKDADLVGYVGIRYQSGKVDKLGIVHTKYVKKQNKTVLWFTLLQKTETKQVNRVSYASDDNGGIREQIVMVNKMIKVNGQWEQQQVATRVPVTTLVSTLESKKKEINSDLSMFLSLYGLSHNGAIKPAKLNTINNGEQKSINVNWSLLTGLKVAPMNKEGIINWHPKFGCPFTVVS